MVGLWYRHSGKMNRSGIVNTRCMLDIGVSRAGMVFSLELDTYELGSVVGEKR